MQNETARAGSFALQGSGKGFHITGDRGRIEKKLNRSQEEVGCVEITAERVAGLPEKSTAVLGVGLGPQGSDELVAADAPVAGGSKGRPAAPASSSAGPRRLQERHRIRRTVRRTS